MTLRWPDARTMKLFKIRLISVFIIIQLLSAAAFADDNLDVSNCVSVLGAGYDKLSNAQKHQRITKYGGCVHNKARLKINNNYKEITRQVGKWHTSSNLSLSQQIDIKAATATDAMRARHRVEGDELDARFDKELRALNNSATGGSTAGLNEQRKQLLQQKKLENTELKQQQNSERLQLRTDINTSKNIAKDTTQELVQKDKDNLLTQLETKQDRIDQQVDQFINTPMDKSINEYEAEQQVEDRDEWLDAEPPPPPSNFSKFLRGVFVFTSGLISRDDPKEVEVDTPMGNLGIRG